MDIFFASLGCDKNLVDSEKMLSLIDEAGYRITDDETSADIIIVNTCAFIADALEESINSIIEYGKLKKDRLKALIVTGCLSQRYQDEIFTELPEVDAAVGTNSYPKIIEVIDSVIRGKSHISIYDSLEASVNPSGRMLSTGGHYAYLKIAEGCDKRCTYCIIPSLRGRYRSFPIEDLLSEATRLVEGGVKEIILVAQEVSVYGIDIYGKKSLPLLLDKLSSIDSLKWIRLLYCYPEEIDDELIAAIKRNDKVCHYIDMPIQHCTNKILRNMGRKTDYDSLVDVISHLRREIPDMAIRTTLITGFPGETNDDHHTLIDFIEDMRFTRLGVFTYSPQEGTASYNMSPRVDDKTCIKRRGDIMSRQMLISRSNNEALLGEVLDVFIEGLLPNDSNTSDGSYTNVYVGRTYMDAPGVDGYFFVHTDDILNSGDFIKARVTSYNEYDLIGVKV